jgi:hypothetical protein
MALVQPAREHGHQGVVGRRLLTVAESVRDGLDPGAVLRHAEVALTLLVQVSSEVDGALTMIVEEDIGQREVELPRRLRAVHYHPGKLPGDGPVDPSLEDQVDGAPLGVPGGRRGVRREVMKNAVLLHGELEKSSPLVVGTSREIKCVGDDILDLDTAHLVGK